MPKPRSPVRAGKAQSSAERASELFAAQLHAAWRRNFRKSNPKEKDLPRMRMRGGVMVDVNQPWAKLHPRARIDNARAARAAYEAVAKFPNDREAAAEEIHKAWIKRNKGDKSQPKALFRPYAQLPESEKDKDRVHVDNIKKAIASVRRQGGAGRTQKPQPVTEFSLTAAQRRALEAARQKLSKVLGREVAMGAFLLAGAEALAAVAKAAPVTPRKRRARD